MSERVGTKSARGRGSNPKRTIDNSKSEDTLEEGEDDGAPAKKVNKIVPKKGKKIDDDEEGVDREGEEDEEEEGDLDEEEEDEVEEEEDEEDDEDGSDASEESNPDQPPKEFGPRSFVVLKADFDKKGVDPPLWRIDGNSLLQKFTPFKDEDGSLLYKSTSVYSGWSVNNKDNYYSAPVVFKRNEKNDFIVKFEMEQVKRSEEKDSK